MTSLISPNSPPVWYSALERRTTNGVKLGLERMRRVLEASHKPQQHFPSILIAGTNGKGSVAAMWDAGLRASGRRTGRYTSPHLSRFTERICIDGEEISWAVLDRLMAQLVTIEQQVGESLTFFEAATWFALMWFAEQRVDVAVLEVGLGGRLDSTNVVEPVLSIVTSIGLDHMEYLGHSVASIAREKAGVFRRNVPAVVGQVSAEALEALAVVANEQGAIFVTCDADTQAIEWQGRSVPAVRPRLLGAHQRNNAKLFALSAVVDQVFKLDDAAIAAGVDAFWPGRLETLTYAGCTFLLDGAHNEQGVLALRDELLLRSTSERYILVFGVVKGEGKRALLHSLADLFPRVFVVPPPTERADNTSEVAAPFSHAQVFPTWQEAVDLAMKEADGRLIVVAGSLYLIGAVRAWLVGEQRDTLMDFR